MFRKVHVANPALADVGVGARITFVGPTAEVLTLTGKKARATAR